MGELAKKRGKQAYSLPANINAADYDTAIIWCRAADVPLGIAPLPSCLLSHNNQRRPRFNNKQSRHSSNSLSSARSKSSARKARLKRRNCPPCPLPSLRKSIRK